MKTLQKLTLTMTAVPVELITNKNLSLGAKGLWVLLSTQQNNDKFSWYSLAAKTKEGATALQQKANELIEAGLLERIGNGPATEYVLLMPEDKE